MNLFDKYDWETMLNRHGPSSYDISEYFNLLCPREDWPAFLDKYLQLPVLKRLQGIGLLFVDDAGIFVRSFERLLHVLLRDKFLVLRILNVAEDENISLAFPCLESAVQAVACNGRPTVGNRISALSRKNHVCLVKRIVKSKESLAVSVESVNG